MEYRYTEKDIKIKQWDAEQHERNMLVSPSYREWWEQNKERILAEDKLRHEMNMKWKIKGNEDRYLDQFENQ
jgi:hypothetical protein